MLMQASFEYITEIGATSLYSDTDSIAFRATPEQYALYETRFVPVEKTFGGMKLEGVYKRLVTIGPKKYACVKEDGSYDWAANGLPAKCNTNVDILAKFERVLSGKVEEADYFSITAGSDFELRHTTGAKKRLRFICLKGRVEDGAVKTWESYEEFQEHARKIQPVGWDVVIPEKDAVVEEDEPAESQEQEVHGVQRVHKKRKVAAVEKPAKVPQYVYILEAECGSTYVGYSPEPDRRLRQHNGELPGGAEITAGKQWQRRYLFGGFVSANEALSFEAILDTKTVSQCSEWEATAADLIANKFTHIHRVQ